MWRRTREPVSYRHAVGLPSEDDVVIAARILGRAIPRAVLRHVPGIAAPTAAPIDERAGGTCLLTDGNFSTPLGGEKCTDVRPPGGCPIAAVVDLGRNTSGVVVAVHPLGAISSKPRQTERHTWASKGRRRQVRGVPRCSPVSGEVVDAGPSGAETVGNEIRKGGLAQAATLGGGQW